MSFDSFDLLKQGGIQQQEHQQQQDQLTKSRRQKKNTRSSLSCSSLATLFVVTMFTVLSRSTTRNGGRSSLSFLYCHAYVPSSLSSSSLIRKLPSATNARYGSFNIQSKRNTILYSTSSSPSSADRSATSQSRAPFRMPRNSPDDSSVTIHKTTATSPTTSSSPSRSSNNKPLNKKGKNVDIDLAWNALGLWSELVDGLRDDLHLQAPTPVQSLVIPELLKDHRDKEDPLERLSASSLAFLAATGSGKTLAYLLPLMQELKQQEVFEFDNKNGNEQEQRRPRRPRLLVLAPTRELALQITSVLKSLSHSFKLSSQALVGGQDKGKQRKAVANRPVDVVVATPGRLIKHWREHTIFLGSVQSIVLDEMDTMLEQGFQRELRQILYPLLYQEQPDDNDKDGPSSSSSKLPPVKENAPRIVMTSATMTQSIQKLLGDNPKTSNLHIRAKRLHASTTGSASSKNKKNSDEDAAAAEEALKRNENKSSYSKLVLPPMRIISAPGLHKAIPRLDQIFVDVGNSDKLSLLVDVIVSSAEKYQRQQKQQGGNGDEGKGNHATMIFCNTAASVRAVQYALSESNIPSMAYHGELNSAARAENLQKFRDASVNGNNDNQNSDIDNDDDDDDDDDYFDDDVDEMIGSATATTMNDNDQMYNLLVCTDLAARGLDIPEVNHVIMFDFPLNAMDYLHRSGRTARGSKLGKVTALVTKRDRVLAMAIENAVIRGDSLDGLSSRKSDYLPTGSGGGGGGVTVNRYGNGNGTNNRRRSPSSKGRSGTTTTSNNNRRGRKSTTRRS